MTTPSEPTRPVDQGQFSPPTAAVPVPAPPRRSKAPLIVGLIAGGVLLLCGCGAGAVFLVGSSALHQAGGPSVKTVSPSPAWSPIDWGAATPTTPAPTTPAETTPAAPPPPPPAPAGPATSIPDDGVYLVGKDIAPGRYRTKVPADSTNCYWARLRNTSGDLGSIIANDNAQAGASQIVTISKSDEAFETDGCGVWTRA